MGASFPLYLLCHQIQKGDLYMLRVVVACTNGMGTSQMIKMTVEKIFAKLSIDCKVLHASIGQAKKDAVNYDVVFCPMPFTNQFDKAAEKGCKVIGVRNLLSAKELEEKITMHIVNSNT